MKTKFILALSIAIASPGCTTLSHKESVLVDRKPNQSSVGKWPESLSFTQLRDLIQTKGLRSIEETLPLLYERYFDYMQFHTLMYDSMSLHESSYEQPRAIVFGRDSKFVLTFNGSSKQAGGKQLETLEYSEPTNTFSFREISFKGRDFDRHELGLEKNEIEFEDDRLVISKPNPNKCLQCHGPQATPIWSGYFNWLGAYGSNDDYLYQSMSVFAQNNGNFNYFRMQAKPVSLGRSMILKNGGVDREVEGYLSYLQAKPTHARYKWLPPHSMDTSFLRFAAGEPYSDLVNDEEVFNRAKENGLVELFRPNFLFLNQLGSLVIKKTLAEFDKKGLRNALKSPAWSTYSKALCDVRPKNSLPAVAKVAHRLLSNFKFRGPQPSLKQVEAAIRKTLVDDIEIQREKMAHQFASFGKNVRYNGDRKSDDDLGYRKLQNTWITDLDVFYSQLLGRKLDDLDLAALSFIADDMVTLTVISLLVADRGVDLHDYSMSLRQDTLGVFGADLGYSKGLLFGLAATAVASCQSSN